LLCGGLGPHLTQCRLAETYLRTKWNLDQSSHLATTVVGRKIGGCAPLGGRKLGSHLAQCRLGRHLPRTKWHLDQFSRLATTDMGRELGGCAHLGGAGSPSNTVWPGPRHTCMPSFSLIRPTVWPQYTNVTDRTDRQTERQIAVR